MAIIARSKMMLFLDELVLCKYGINTSNKDQSITTMIKP